jgi:hypothetical protein
LLERRRRRRFRLCLWLRAEASLVLLRTLRFLLRLGLCVELPPLLPEPRRGRDNASANSSARRVALFDMVGRRPLPNTNQLQGARGWGKNLAVNRHDAPVLA